MNRTWSAALISIVLWFLCHGLTAAVWEPSTTRLGISTALAVVALIVCRNYTFTLRRYRRVEGAWLFDLQVARAAKAEFEHQIAQRCLESAWAEERDWEETGGPPADVDRLGSALSPRLLDALSAYVRAKMASNSDPSHDWLHVERVWRLARLIAVAEGVPDTTVVELAALCHDLNDWKHKTAPAASSDDEGPIAELIRFLLGAGVSGGIIEQTIMCIHSASFKNSLPTKMAQATANALTANPPGNIAALSQTANDTALARVKRRGNAAAPTSTFENRNQSTDGGKACEAAGSAGKSGEVIGKSGEVHLSLAAKIVRDADRLDAIGAIGIGRTFCFGGRVNLPMFHEDQDIVPVVSQADYMKRGRTTVIAHFFDKLLRLRDLMLTKTGRQLAQRRHGRLVQFVDAFLDEAAISSPRGVDAFRSQPAVRSALSS